MRRAAALVALWALAGCAAAPPAQPPPPSNPTPTATTQRVPPLHLAGEAPAAPPSLGPPGAKVRADYHVCLDPSGHVERVEPAPGVAAVDATAMAALRGWSWFILSDEPRPCFDVHVDLVVPAVSHVIRQATSDVVGRITQGTVPGIPAWVMAANTGRVLDAAYKVCVGEDGVLQSVRPLNPILGAGDALVSALRGSSWDVIVGPLARAPFCFTHHAHIDLPHGPAPPYTEMPAIPYPAEGVHAAEPGKSIVMSRKRVSGEPPQLSAEARRAAAAGSRIDLAYRLCVRADGSVATVAPIKPAPGNDDPAFIQTLRAWRFAVAGPPGVGFCEIERFAYAIDRP